MSWRLPPGESGNGSHPASIGIFGIELKALSWHHLVSRLSFGGGEALQAASQAGVALADAIIADGNSDGLFGAHQHHDLPIALVAGSRFFEGNRHLVYPKDTPLNNLFLSMFAKANVSCAGFGDSTGLLPYV